MTQIPERWASSGPVQDLEIPPGGWLPSATFYVDQRYQGGDSDGSAAKPFTRIQPAIDLAWATVASTEFALYATVVIAPGEAAGYVEDALLLYPFVTLVGASGGQDSVLVDSAVPARLFSFGNYDVSNIRFVCAFDSDQTSLPFFNFFTWMRFFDCQFEDRIDVEGIGGADHWWEFHGCTLFAEVAVSNATLVLDGCEAYGNAYAEGAPGASSPFVGKDGGSYAAFLGVYGGFVEDTTGEQTGPLGTWVELGGFAAGNGLFNGAGTRFEIYAGSEPEEGWTVTGSARRYYPPSQEMLTLTLGDAGAELLDGRRYYVAPAAADSYAVDLPEPSQAVAGILVYNASTGTITLSATGGGLFQPGAGAALALAPGESAEVSAPNATDYTARVI